jgi:hypothetical protein
MALNIDDDAGEGVVGVSPPQPAATEARINPERQMKGFMSISSLNDQKHFVS